MKRKPLYAALDLHSGHSVLGSMDHEGKALGQRRFATAAEKLKQEVVLLGSKHRREVHLTLEASGLSRWAVGIVWPLVERLIICEPRHNRYINGNPTKSDEADVEGMCLLLRLGKLKEVWMGEDRTREIYRALVYELLNWRDAQRELKARYPGWGMLKLNGLKVFSKTLRQQYLEELPGEEERSYGNPLRARPALQDSGCLARPEKLARYQHFLPLAHHPVDRAHKIGAADRPGPILS
jgi:hypothetical protein